MQLTLTPTDQLVELKAPGGGSIVARACEGQDTNGVPVIAWIAQVLVPTDQPPEIHDRFAVELKALPAPRPAPQVFDLRYFID